jgi:hypothetical protein
MSDSMEDHARWWRNQCLLWQAWATHLLHDLGRQPPHGEHGCDAMREIIGKLVVSEWRRVVREDGYVTVKEGEAYMFAIETGDGWEYFSDSITWDSETLPEWVDGCHGWSLTEGELWFTDLPSPPEPK